MLSTFLPRLMDRLRPCFGRLDLWLILLGLWSYLLLTPEPVKEGKAILGEMAQFVLAKTLHFSVYGALTLYAATIRSKFLSFRSLVCLLLLHGVTTEYLQSFVPQRSGTVRDVFINALGITLACYSLYRMGRLELPGLRKDL